MATIMSSPLWMPPNASLHGAGVDHLMRWNLVALGSLFLLAHVLLAIVLLRRLTSSADSSLPRTWRAQALPMAFFCLMYFVMAVTSARLWANERFEGAAPAAMQVEVTGRQFQWYFRYPGKDATFGSTQAEKIQPAEGNPLGLDPSDEHGRDDVVASELVLPVGREVDLTLHAQDVIHGFFLPAMRLKQNALPGQSLHVHFTPIESGVYPILCTQVCGLGHARMQARMRVVSAVEFAKWLQAKSPVRPR